MDIYEAASIKKCGLYTAKGLSEKELNEINNLEEICSKYEHLNMKLHWSLMIRRSKEEINDFLYYENDKLIGFLGIYIFNNYEAEVSGMVHPDYRQRGIFANLLSAAVEECKSRKIPKMLFICENCSKGAKEFVNHIGAKYSFSEYKMELIDATAISPASHKIVFRRARVDDAHDRAVIMSLCFDIPIEGEEKRFIEDVKQSNRFLFLGELDGKVIGKIDAVLIKGNILIYGFGMLPEQRGKGYGREMLNNILVEVIKHNSDKIILEVVADNNKALNLYKSVGFHERTSYDYYELVL